MNDVMRSVADIGARNILARITASLVTRARLLGATATTIVIVAAGPVAIGATVGWTAPFPASPSVQLVLYLLFGALASFVVGAWFVKSVSQSGNSQSRERGRPTVFSPLGLGRPKTGAGLGLAMAQRLLRELDRAEKERARIPLLLIDDEESMRVLLREALSRTGYEVFEAKNGVEALELIRATGVSPDLVLTDVTMPGVGEADILADLKNLAGAPPILYLRSTGRSPLEPAEPSERAEALASDLRVRLHAGLESLLAEAHTMASGKS